MIYPPDFTNVAYKEAAARHAARMIADLVPERRAVVQAGGCAGLWPLALATHFAQVYTFEPDPANFQCLSVNVASVPHIAARQAALGECERSVGLTRPKAQAGLWRVDGDGAIPMVRLDDVLGEAPIDALVLDVEGSEAQALHGAAHILVRHRPVVWVEYLQHLEAIQDALAIYGYTRPVRGFAEDYYSVHASRIQHKGAA